jgi:hypothetical protein
MARGHHVTYSDGCKMSLKPTSWSILSSETNSCPARQEILNISLNLKVHYLIHKIQKIGICPSPPQTFEDTKIRNKRYIQHYGAKIAQSGDWL